MQVPIFPSGHFYSPIVNTDTLTTDKSDDYWVRPGVCAGIDFNPARQLEILQTWFPRFIGSYDYPDEGEPFDPKGYFNLNDQFGVLDSRALFVFLQAVRPKRMIEVGSGFSSLLVADVNQRFLGNACEFTCIEPYPREFLKRGVPGMSRLLIERVERVDPAEFTRLEAGDILFIDSSHVAKTGSDVNFLFFEVLPLLRPGVLVHVHDIFLPLEYPRQWVISDNRSWNEQYVLQALLMYSTRFKVMFGCAYAATHLGSAVVAALARPDGHGMGGGSLWIEVQ